MIIGDRIRAIREAKKLSQGDIEKRSRLLRPYLSRIENGHCSTWRSGWQSGRSLQRPSELRFADPSSRGKTASSFDLGNDLESFPLKRSLENRG